MPGARRREMRVMKIRLSCGLALVVLVASSGACRSREAAPSPPPSPRPPATQATPEQVAAALKGAAERDRQSYAGMTFEQFKASKAVYQEKFPGGKYIVNGDTPLLGDKQLREFFEKNVKQAPAPPSPTHPHAELIVGHVGGLDLSWNQSMQGQLTYCVSRSEFGSHYDAVVRDMQAATQAWQDVAAVAFRHDAAQDASCSPANAAVVFDVRPVDVQGEYLARAFFPNEPRPDRNVLIDGSSFDLPASGKLQLAGILRHELGHSLGFRHEHTRPSAGRCFEDAEWRELTAYDAYSVMHYPQCNGLGDWSLTLTPRDRSGAACLYGPTAGFTIDPSLVTSTACRTPLPTTAPGLPKTDVFASQTVAEGKDRQYGPFAVVEGSRLEATIGGPDASGDPDLYVRFAVAPTTDAYNCRPFLASAEEKCALDVPPGQTRAFVMVHGYSAAKYRLEVKHLVPANP